MFDNVKREFIKENGISNGDTTKRSDIFKDYQLSVSKDKRLSGTWTLEQYEGQYRAAMYAAVKSANPNWKPGQKFDTSILDNVTRESVESTLVKNGNRLVRNSIDVSVSVSYTHLDVYKRQQRRRIKAMELIRKWQRFRNMQGQSGSRCRKA